MNRIKYVIFDIQYLPVPTKRSIYLLLQVIIFGIRKA